jgi:hypothetical protein
MIRQPMKWPPELRAYACCGISWDQTCSPTVILINGPMVLDPAYSHLLQPVGASEEQGIERWSKRGLRVGPREALSNNAFGNNAVCWNVMVWVIVKNFSD